MVFHCQLTHIFSKIPGSLQITASQIICPKHYQPPKKLKNHHINTSWCFICSKGGDLICCELCPASFHIDCLKIPDLNAESKYFCDNCETGRMHLYGEVRGFLFLQFFTTTKKCIFTPKRSSNIGLNLNGQRMFYTF